MTNGITRRLKFGLALDYFDGDLPMIKNFEIVLKLVEAAQEANFDLIYHAAHFLESDYARFQPLPLISGVTARSGQMLLVYADILPLNHPVRIAEEFATLDVISNGRAILLGVLGYQRSEFQAFGIDMRERAGRMRSSYEIVSRLLMGEVITVKNKYHDLRNVRLGGLLKPVSAPRPPIWVTAHNEAGIRRAAAHGDVWLISHQPRLRELEGQVRRYGEYRGQRAEESFHSFESHGVTMPLLREGFVAETSTEAIQLAQEPMMATVNEYVRSGQLSALEDAPSYQLPFDEWRVDRALIGDPDEVGADLMRYQATLGIDCVILKLHRKGIPFGRILDAIRLTGEHIMPRFRSDSAAASDPHA